MPYCCQVQYKFRSQFLGPLCLWQCFICWFWIVYMFVYLSVCLFCCLLFSGDCLKRRLYQVKVEVNWSQVNLIDRLLFLVPPFIAGTENTISSSARSCSECNSNIKWLIVDWVTSIFVHCLIEQFATVISLQQFISILIFIKSTLCSRCSESENYSDK